ncbi:MAG: SDR family NAD(P)-dependent oxidoreductase [Actinobacteria bacterium]|nr:SDR family NAD(P)-dependent oxidoreductase [Actinomycetota bacterium]
MDWHDKSVVITGAASGIGRETTLAFARRGARVAVVDIDGAKLSGVKDELEEMCADIYYCIVDVSNADEMRTMCDGIYRKWKRVDVLINNAGIAMGGPFEHMTLQDWKRMVDVNFWGIVHGCHFFYPRMIDQGGGHIVNVASAAGLVPMFLQTSYCATKSAVVGFSESLRGEAARHNIGVTAVCPGIVDTPIASTVELIYDGEHRNSEALRGKVEHVFHGRGYTPDRVAEAIVKAVEKNRNVAPICPETYAMDYIHRISRDFYNFLHRLSVKAVWKWVQGDV